MKQIISTLLIALIFLSGCISNTEMKYQCFNGDVVDSVELCPKQNCPDLNCSECPKQVETETKEVIKYECYDGSVEDELSNCDEPKAVIKYQCQDGAVKDSLTECQDASHSKVTFDGQIYQIDENTYDVNNVLVSISFYHVEGMGIGEYITIQNNRDEIVGISTGCNYPVSAYADGCRGWSLRDYEDYPSFTYKYIEPQSKLNGWVWGIDEEFLESYDTNKFRATINVDGQEILFNKTLEDIDFWN